MRWKNDVDNNNNRIRLYCNTHAYIQCHQRRKDKRVEYEVGYLLYTIFEKDLPKRELDDEDIRKIKDELDKRMK